MLASAKAVNEPVAFLAKPRQRTLPKPHSRLTTANTCSPRADARLVAILRLEGLVLPWVSLWPAEPGQQIELAQEQARQGQLGHFVAPCPTAKGVPKFWDVRVTPIHGAT